MKDLCNRLSAATGLTFRIDSDTCEPAAGGGRELRHALSGQGDGPRCNRLPVPDRDADAAPAGPARRAALTDGPQR